jgi:hypothetical protein
MQEVSGSIPLGSTILPISQNKIISQTPASGRLTTRYGAAFAAQSVLL